MNSINANQTVELVNGKILDVEQGAYYPQGTVVQLKEGKIAALYHKDNRELAQKADYRLDLKGLTVLPGLFNTHTHVNWLVPALLMGMKDIGILKKYKVKQVEFQLEDCLNRGITTVRDALADHLDDNNSLIERIQKDLMPGPRIYNAVHIGPLGGTFTEKTSMFQRFLFSMMGFKPGDYRSKNYGAIAVPPAASAREVREAVDRALDERGADFIKFYDQREKKLSYKPGALIFSQEQLDAAADQCRKRGVKSLMHHVTVESFRRALLAGVDTISHMPGDAPLTEADITAFLQSGCFLEPTFSVAFYYCLKIPGTPYETHPHINAIAALQESLYEQFVREYWISEFQNTALQGYNQVKQGKFTMFGFMNMQHVYDYFAGFAVQGFDNIRRICAAGGEGRIITGTDAGASHSSAANLELELLLLNRFAGLKGQHLLRAATINSARALGLDETAGSISPGKRADLALYQGDPLADWQLIGKPVAALFKDGRLLLNRAALTLE